VKKLLLAAFAAMSLFAQTTEIVHVKNGDVDRIAKMVSTFGAAINSDNSLRVISVKGTPETVQAVVAAIKSLDQPEAPQPNIELTVYLLFGAAKEAGPDSIPQDLASTVKQLKSIFPYKSYKIMDTWMMRSRDRQTSQTSGTLPGTQINFQFSVQPSVVPGPAPRSVHLANLRLGLDIPNESHQSSTHSGIGTDLDAKEGQKTVVGKSNISGTEDALILVVIPKVIE
jgi:hypothetical protein